jgi:hypothetical protein
VCCPLLPTVPPPLFPGMVVGALSADDLLLLLVDWIQRDTYYKTNRHGNFRKTSTSVVGWDERWWGYGWKGEPTPCVHLSSVNPAILYLRTPFRDCNNPAMAAAVKRDLTTPYRGAQNVGHWIFIWGGLRRFYTNYLDTWKTLKIASGVAQNSPPFTAGWTKVASFATQLSDCPQVIWDSRVSVSIIHRLDILVDTYNHGHVPLEFFGGIHGGHPGKYAIRALAGLGGTRTKPNLRVFKHFPNTPAGYSWQYHFGGSAVVRKIVEILNKDSKYPRMPVCPDDVAFWDEAKIEYYRNLDRTRLVADWNVWGVGMVLFMDGY